MSRIQKNTLSYANLIVWILAGAVPVPAAAQLSSSAYRVLGQPDFRQNGVNRVEGAELGQPAGIALDTRDGKQHVYVADTGNHRVMAWDDAAAAQNGASASLVLGQPSPQTSTLYGIGAKGFNSPLGLAVDPATGNLYVADFSNNRVLRFRAPFSNPAVVEPDAVYGQPGFSTFAANTGGLSASSMSGPRALAFDALGNLWVADSGNNRIVRFSAAVLDAPNPPADLVVGQPDLHSAGTNRGATVSASGFDSPRGLAFDAQNNLYVADFNNTRVLRFSAPLGPNAAATVVLGEVNFTSRGVPQTASAASMTGPNSLALDSFGNVFVAVPLDNRILMFPAGAASGTPATAVFGQSNFTTTTANTGAFPKASASALSGVTDIRLDANGSLYAADTGNNRAIVIPRGSGAANLVLGQSDFTANGYNRVNAGSLRTPFSMAVDYSQSPFALYVSDPANHRVLGWLDAARFRSGAPADLAIGQPDLTTAIANSDTGGTSTPSRTSLSGPRGIAVDSLGRLYVADSGNNRVLRYPRPASQQGRIAPDLVLGQADFTSALSAAVSAASLRLPSAVAIGPDGHVFVADTGNNRVLEFPSGPTGAAALRVFGQPAFSTSAAPTTVSAQTLTGPLGIYVDGSSALYVADTAANRVVIYPDTKDAPAIGSSAAVVLGQTDFGKSTAGGGASSLRTPFDVALDSGGNIYVSDTSNNRVLAFPSLLFLPASGAAATSVAGQPNLSSAQPNYDSPDGLATAEGLVAPAGIYLDRRNTLYVGDTGNNRVVHFLKTAAATNAASSASSAVGKGAWTTLYAPAADSVTGPVPAPLPTQLGGREVVVNDDLLAPLWYVSPTQINFILPSAAPAGLQRIAVRVAGTAELIAGGLVSVAQYSPGIFTANQGGFGQAFAFNQDGSVNGPGNPAARGTVVRLFGTGPGPYAPPPADGTAAPGLIPTVAAPSADAATCLTANSVCVAVGSKLAEVQFSGTAQGLVAIWQVNVKIPDDALTGPAILVRVLVHQTPSNLFSLAIQ